MELVHFSHPHRNDLTHLKFDELNTDYPKDHAHVYYELTIVTNGQYIMKMNDKSFILNQYECSFCTLNDRHAIYRKTPNIAHTSVILEKEYFEAKCNAFSNSFLKLLYSNDLSKIPLSKDDLNKIISYLNTLKSKTITYEKEEAVTNLIINFVIDILFNHIEKTQNNAFPEHFNKMLNALSNFENASWKVKDLADYAGYTETHVNRLFQKYIGVSTNKYINKIKLTNAKYMLSVSNRSISEITENLGFSSKSHFINTFKKEFGITPYQYRLEHK